MCGFHLSVLGNCDPHKDEHPIEEMNKASASELFCRDKSFKNNYI